MADRLDNSGCITCGAALREDGKCEASGMTPAVCGNKPFLMAEHPYGQPVHARILLSDDGNGYDAMECATCREVIGPWPQPPHTLPDCVRSLAARIEANHVS